MARMTITEGLAELKTLAKRVEKKREFVMQHAFRTEAIKDPLESDGGSKVAITQARQAIHDLNERRISIRQAIAESNARTEATVLGDSRSVAKWLIWRREHADQDGAFITGLVRATADIRKKAMEKGSALVEVGGSAQRNDIVVHFSESDAAKERERHEELLGTLDGVLSLLNATTFIDVED